MITTRLVGRLGNSLYQVAACIAYAKKFNYQQWGVPFVPTGDEGMKSAIHNVFPNLPKTGDRPRQWPRDGYEPRNYDFFEFENQGSDVLLAGFWQSYKWFEWCNEEIKAWFHMDRLPGYEEYVSLHIRLGDYVNNSDSFPPINMEYIRKAIAEMDNRTDLKKYLVFSDDMQWCFDNLKNDGVHTFEFHHASEREDLQMMVSCGSHVISNSSFAFWGAYLGHNKDRVIVAPHHAEWYGPGNGVVQYARSIGSDPCKDLIPPNFIEVKFR